VSSGKYNRAAAVAYAHQWAFSRNPQYLNFDGMGGDCTSFVSQCLRAGGAPQNYTKTFGWYYNSANDRAPAWSGVPYLYNFLTKNKGAGVYAAETVLFALEPGDVIQLSFTPGVFGHSLLVVETGTAKDEDHVLIATHTDDSDYRPLSSYNCIAKRFLKIGIRNGRLI
jgi:hypothetical protein